MTKAEFNSDLIAIVAGNVTVYNYDGETREYLSYSDESIPVGVGIPANSCIEEPVSRKAGFAVCRTPDFSSWEYVADHRGEKVFSTVTGEEILILDLGDYPVDTTKLPPSTPYDKWDGKNWITDISAKHESDVIAAEMKKQALVDQANAYMNSKQWPGKAVLGRLKGVVLRQFVAF